MKPAWSNARKSGSAGTGGPKDRSERSFGEDIIIKANASDPVCLSNSGWSFGWHSICTAFSLVREADEVPDHQFSSNLTLNGFRGSPCR
jgi:hypothetical protein